jgi:HEAT repeat protein
LLEKGADADIPPYLQAEDDEVRGLAVLACGRLGIKDAASELRRLLSDPAPFRLYANGAFAEVSVGQMAQQALESMDL